MERIILRGMGRQTVRGYLLQLAHSTDEPDIFVGAGWTARLFDGEAYAIGALTFNEVVIEFDGDPEAAAHAAASLRRLTMRTGG
jgi:hypothetical protein